MISKIKEPETEPCAVRQRLMTKKDTIICMMNKSFCSYAWYAMAIKPNGTCAPCCRYEGEEFSLNNRNSHEWKSLREKMLNGQVIDGCSKCYREESSSIVSLREMANCEYPNYANGIEVDQSSLKYLEVSIGRRCNLKCLICSPAYSTYWEADYTKLGWNINLATKADTDLTSIFEKNKNINKLKILGGEPFLYPAGVILNSSLNLEGVHLAINTNGTIFPSDEWLSLFEKCKRTSISISIDGVGEVSDFTRYPSKWEKIEENTLSLLMLDKKYKVTVRLHTTISIYNVFNLEKIYQWWDQALKKTGSGEAKASGIDRNIKFVPLVLPKELSIHILSKRIKNLLIMEYSDIDWSKGITSTVSINESVAQLQEFVNYTRQLFAIRNINPKDVIDKRLIEELEDLWQM